MMTEDDHHHNQEESSPAATSTTPCPFLLLKKQAKQQQDQKTKNKKTKSRRKPHQPVQQEEVEEDIIMIDDEDVINSFVLFNQDLASRDYCKDKVQMKNRDHNDGLFNKKCNCLKILHHNQPFCAAVGGYQAYFAGQKREDQQKIAIDWMRTCEGV